MGSDESVDVFTRSPPHISHCRADSLLWKVQAVHDQKESTPVCVFCLCGAKEENSTRRERRGPQYGHYVNLCGCSLHEGSTFVVLLALGLGSVRFAVVLEEDVVFLAFKAVDSFFLNESHQSQRPLVCLCSAGDST